GQVEDVVDQQLIVGLYVQGSVHPGPAGLHVLAEVWDQRGVGDRGAEPDEDQAVQFAGREAARPEAAAGNRVARHVGAGAVGGEADTVVAALDVVADHFTGGERRLAVRAAVGKRGDLAVLAAEDHHRFVADRARERFFA